MKLCKRACCVIGGILFWLYLSGCIQNNQSAVPLEATTSQNVLSSNNIQEVPPDLAAWVGTYDYFYEMPFPIDAEPKMAMEWDWKITIYEANTCYVADINGSGWNLDTRLQANVIGNQDTISLSFLAYESGPQLNKKFNRDDIVFQLVREDGKIFVKDTGGVLMPEDSLRYEFHKIDM